MGDTKRMNFQIIMPSERSKYKQLHITSFYLYEMSGKGKTARWEYWLWVAWGWKWEEGLIALSSEEPFWGKENNLKLDCSDGSLSLYIYQKTSIILYLKISFW